MRAGEEDAAMGRKLSCAQPPTRTALPSYQACLSSARMMNISACAAEHVFSLLCLMWSCGSFRVDRVPFLGHGDGFSPSGLLCSSVRSGSHINSVSLTPFFDNCVCAGERWRVHCQVPAHALVGIWDALVTMLRPGRSGLILMCSCENAPVFVGRLECTYVSTLGLLNRHVIRGPATFARSDCLTQAYCCSCLVFGLMA